jgi:hypothetical protein
MAKGLKLRAPRSTVSVIIASNVIFVSTRVFFTALRRTGHSKLSTGVTLRKRSK